MIATAAMGVLASGVCEAESWPQWRNDSANAGLNYRETLLRRVPAWRK